MYYKHDKVTGHHCIYNSVWAIGWLPGGKTHWINEWPYFHAGLGCLQFCIVAE